MERMHCDRCGLDYPRGINHEQRCREQAVHEALEELSSLVGVFKLAADMQKHIDERVMQERAACAAVARRCADALANDPNKYARTVALKIAADIERAWR